MNGRLIAALIGIVLVGGYAASIQVQYDQMKARTQELTLIQVQLQKDCDRMLLENRGLNQENTALLDRIEQMNATYNELLVEHDKLLAAHNMVHDPNDRITVLENLLIKFAADRAVYNYADDITGKFEIYYIDGTMFGGYFQIIVIKDGEWIAVSPYLLIWGKCSWKMQSPVFKNGPGTYEISLCHLVAMNNCEIARGVIEGTTLQVEVK